MRTKTVQVTWSKNDRTGSDCRPTSGYRLRISLTRIRIIMVAVETAALESTKSAFADLFHPDKLSYKQDSFMQALCRSVIFQSEMNVM